MRTRGIFASGLTALAAGLVSAGTSWALPQAPSDPSAPTPPTGAAGANAPASTPSLPTPDGAPDATPDGVSETAPAESPGAPAPKKAQDRAGARARAKARKVQSRAYYQRQQEQLQQQAIESQRIQSAQELERARINAALQIEQSRRQNGVPGNGGPVPGGPVATITGTLSHNVVSIGSAYDTVDGSDGWTYQLDYSARPELATRGATLHGLPVRVTGKIIPSGGVVVSGPRVLSVTDLRASGM